MSTKRILSEAGVVLTGLKGKVNVLAQAFPNLANVITAFNGSMGAGFGVIKSFKIALYGLWNVIKAHPVVATVTAITALVGVINSASEAAREAAEQSAEKSKELINKNKEKLSSLDDLVSKYKELAESDKTDSANRESIKKIQDEITQLVGSQAENLDLVNGKLKEQLKLINDIYETETTETTSAYRRAYDTAIQHIQDTQYNEFYDTWLVGGLTRWLANLSDADLSSQILIKDSFGELSGDVLPEIEKKLKESGLDANTNTSGLDFVLNLPEKIGDRVKALDVVIKTLESFDGYEDNKLWEKLTDIRGELNTLVTNAENSADDLLNNLLDSEYFSKSGQESIGGIDSLNKFMSYRQDLINKLSNDADIKKAIEDGVLNSDYVSKQADAYLSTLPEISDYYNEWYKKFGSDIAKSVNDLKDKLKLDVYFFEPENLSNGKNDTIEKWFNNLTDKQKDIIVKIQAQFETDDWSFEKWQKEVKNWKTPETDKINFSDLIETEDFQDKVKYYKDNITSLADALKKLHSDELSESDKIELFENFPELASQADNLDEAIVNLVNSFKTDTIDTFNEKLGYMKTNDDVKALNALKDSILNLASETNEISKTTDEIEKLKGTLSDLKGTYDSITGIIDDYNENGYYTIDNLKSLLELEPAYINALIDENGQINLNSQSYKNYVAAKAKTLVVDQIKSLYENILAMSKEEVQAYANATAYKAESDSLEDLITTTTQYYMVLARAKDVENNTTVYTEGLQKSFGTVANYAAVYNSWLNSLSTSTNEFSTKTKEAKAALEKQKEALESQKDALEDTKNGYENAIDSIKSLIDWTENYIKQTKEDEIDALEKKKQSVDDLIESQKELLQAQKDEYDWNKEISDKQNEVAKNALAASIASLDDSSAGKKTYKEAIDTLSESRSEMADSLYEHSIEVRLDALDKMKEQSDKYYDDEIDKINEFLNDEVALYRAACSMIDNDNGTLYSNLLNYCKTYTTTSEAEFNRMWSSAQSAIRTYKGDNDTLIGVMEILQTKIGDCETQISNLDDAISQTSDAISATSDSIDSVSSSLGGLGSAIDDYMAKLQAAVESTNNFGNGKKTGFWVNYNGKKYQTGYNYSGDTKSNRLLAANELTKLIAKDVSGFDQYGLGIVQGLLGVGNGNAKGWYYNFQGKTYNSTSSKKENAISQILSQIEDEYGGRLPASAVSIYGQIKHYAKGTRNSVGGLSITQEDGFEAIFQKLQNGEYTMMPKGSQVFNAGMTDNLWKFSSDPQKFLSDVIGKMSSFLSSSYGNFADRARGVTNKVTKYVGDMTFSSAPVYHIYGKVDNDTLNKMDKQEKQRYELFKKQFMLEMLREKNNL